MYVLMKAPIGTMPALTMKGEAERVGTNAISLISHVINTDSGVAHFTLAFGGVDSCGTFHRDTDKTRSKEVCNIVMERDNPDTDAQRAVFDGLFKDANGNAKCDYPRSFFESLLCASLIPLAYKLVWGGKYRDMEVFMDGELIFQPDHLKPKLETAAI